MWLIAIDDFVLSDVGIPPAMVTNQSAHLGFGVDRRSGVSASVFFSSRAEPATWHVLLQCPDVVARNALIAVLAAPRHEQVRLLAQREPYGEDLVTTEAAITSVKAHGSSDTLEVTFDSNDSVWFAEDVKTVEKLFTSPLDQAIYVPVDGNVPTNAVIRITPTQARATPTADVGWKYRRRFALTNGGDEPLYRYGVLIPLGNTAALVSASKALASGDDLRVWLHGLEQSRTLVDWNTSDGGVWVIVPALPPGESLTYDIVYGNTAATDASALELRYPDAPAFDMVRSTNYAQVYPTETDIANAGLGLWVLDSPLEGGSADFGVPGAWQPALTFENPNNTDSYVHPRAERVGEGSSEWYQARLLAARWRGPGFESFNAYAGSDPFDGVTIHNPFGVRAVAAQGLRWRNDASVKTVVTTTVGDQTASDEVLVPHDPPFTRVVVIGRNSGGDNWHVFQEYGGTVGSWVEGLRLYFPFSGAPSISPAPAAGWNLTTSFDRVAAVSSHGATPTGLKSTTFASVTAGDDLLLRQYIYPLPEGLVFSTSDTVKGQTKAATGGTSAAMRAQLVIRVMTATSVVRATLLDFDTGAFANGWGSVVTENHKFPRNAPVNLQADYTTVTGDYLVMEYGARTNVSGSNQKAAILVGEGETDPLPELENSGSGYPWIEFSVTPDTDDATLAETWIPSRPIKHFGIACWPYGSNEIPQDAESRVAVAIDGDVTVHVAAEPLVITETQPETGIYELATELRLHGGADATAPYDALLIGNARQESGPGTPRAALDLFGEGLQIDAEHRTHTVWDTEFTIQAEVLSAHAVRAVAGSLRDVDATSIPGLQRIPVVITNSTFTGSITGWSVEQTDPAWTYSVVHSGTTGNTANGPTLGSLKFLVTTSDPGTVLYRNSTLVPVNPEDSVEVTAWVRQLESGSSSPRLGVVWYDAASVALGTDLDAFSDLALNPSVDQQLLFAGRPPATATQFRVVVGVSSITNVDATKWFDDVTVTLLRPLRYDGSLAKVTQEARTSQWLPLAPPRRLVANGGFDADLASWEAPELGTGVTATVARDGAFGGDQLGAMKITIIPNTGSNGVSVTNAQYFGVNGAERVEMSAWVRTSNGNMHPRLAILWYQDESDTWMIRSLEPAWATNPTANTPYTRVFAAIVPPEMTRFRLAVHAIPAVAGTTATVYFDDVRLNDNALMVADAAMGRLDVDVIVRPRWVP